MKTILRKSVIVFCLVILAVVALVISASAEKTDFAATEFSDITAANGWVHIASKSAQADEDGKDIELYFISQAEAYLNRETKTLVILGKDKILSGDYGDWNVSETKNTPGAKYYLIWWAVDHSAQVEHIEFRDCGPFINACYILQKFKHAKTVKFATSANGTYGNHCRGGLFAGMTSLTTVGHGTFDQSGKFTPTSYTEGIADLTGFTILIPRPGYQLSKSAFYFAGTFYQCEAVKEVILPKTLIYTEKYKMSVEKDGAWSSANFVEVDATKDEFGGEYSGILGMWMFSGATSLSKVTIPEGVDLKIIEANVFAETPIRCITVKGTVSPDIKIDATAFTKVPDGCIIQCSREEDIDVLNKALANNNITAVKAVDMSVEPTRLPTLTKLPFIPAWQEFNPEGATAYGEITGTYCNNYWAYYADTKTITFTAKAKNSYNEIGNIKHASGEGWIKYKTEIEHAIVGPEINKLTASAFAGMTNLVDIRITSEITEASETFTECPSLTTIWVEGSDRVEGQAMLAGAKRNFKLNFSQTAIRVIHMGSSPITFAGNIVCSPKTSTLVFDIPSQEMIDYCKENYLNIQNADGEMIGNWYVEVPEGLPKCGTTAVFDFDETTGTLTILGKGAVDDISNYWGGGSKLQFWFDIKKNIKHVIVGEHITTIGKYAFTECENLETVQLPNKDGLQILSAAFEDCYNLKSIYIEGNQPIEGTYDLSTIDRFQTYMFADNFRLANIILNENVEKIGESVFDNCVNLQGIYGVPGSFAEEYASNMNLPFYDAASNTPQPITCTPPAVDTTVPETEPTTPGTQDTQAPDTQAPITSDTTPDTQPVSGGDDQTTDGGSNILPVIIIVAAVVVVAAVAVIVIIAKKKSKKS